jgi:hypothetical protein
MPDLSRDTSQQHKEDEIYMLTNAYERRIDQMRGIGNHSVFNGSTKIITWLLTINALLIVAAISGGIGFAMKSSERMASLENKVEILMFRIK